jgi:hypothetical protein
MRGSYPPCRVFLLRRRLQCGDLYFQSGWRGYYPSQAVGGGYPPLRSGDPLTPLLGVRRIWRGSYPTWHKGVPSPSMPGGIPPSQKAGASPAHAMGPGFPAGTSPVTGPDGSSAPHHVLYIPRNDPSAAEPALSGGNRSKPARVHSHPLKRVLLSIPRRKKLLICHEPGSAW